MRHPTIAALLLACLGGCAPATLDDTDGSGKGVGELATPPNPLVLGKDDGSYVPSATKTFADGHWDDGIGLCAEFSSRSLRAGSLSIPRYTWVPDLYAALESFPYDEYSASSPTDVGGDVGDVIIYSNDVGDEFCDRDNPADYNCGHTGIIVVAGTDLDSTLADFHNRSHYHMSIGDILTGTRLGRGVNDYSAYRVYHLSR
jgi:hypothetical protein